MRQDIIIFTWTHLSPTGHTGEGSSQVCTHRGAARQVQLNHITPLRQRDLKQRVWKGFWEPQLGTLQFGPPL